MATLVGFMFMMTMFGGCAIGGIWMLSKANDGNNPVARAVNGFMEGLRGETPTPMAFTGSRCPEPVEVVRTESPVVRHVDFGATSDVVKRPDKAMAVVFLFLAALYFLSPIDIVPDLIPGFCHLDDLGIIALAVRNAMKAFA